MQIICYTFLFSSCSSTYDFSFSILFFYCSSFSLLHLFFLSRYTRGNVRMVVPIQLSAGLVYLPSFFLASALETLFLQITGFLRRRKEKKNKLKRLQKRERNPTDSRFSLSTVNLLHSIYTLFSCIVLSSSCFSIDYTSFSPHFSS